MNAEKSNLLKRATDPNQYDSNDLKWERDATIESTRTFFFWQYLAKYMPTWRGKKILDVGSGNGWLLNEALKAGASVVVGIESSIKNIELSKIQNPEVKAYHSTFVDFPETSRTFDVIVFMMTLSHMQEIPEVFSKIRSLLSENGELIIVVPDFSYFKIERNDYLLEIETIDENQYVVGVTRPNGTIADIVRKNSIYIEIATKNNLRLIEQVAMLPTDEYLARAPKYAKLKDYPLSQLLRFRKV